MVRTLLSSREMNMAERTAPISPTRTLNEDVALVGDDISSDSIAVFRFPFFQSVDGILNLIYCELFYEIVLCIIFLVVFSIQLHASFSVVSFAFV